jgi:hypothetical protein
MNFAFKFKNGPYGNYRKMFQRNTIRNVAPKNVNVNVNNTIYYSWNRPLWIFIHTLCNKVPDEKDSINTVFKYLEGLCTNIIPCLYCKNDSIAYFKIHKLQHSNKNALRMFFFNFHNHVNKKLKKQVFNNDILKLYDDVDIERFAKKVFPLLNMTIGFRKNTIIQHNKLVKVYETYFNTTIKALLKHKKEDVELENEIIEK